METSAPSPAITATHTAALALLRDFVPKAGKYAGTRNHDLPGHPHVSRLSPYIRHRVITEQEVLQAVLGRYSASTVDKFVQEVFWRTYWKGWLELRPSVWTHYQARVRRATDRLATEEGLRHRWDAACTGATGIAPFDHWAQELARTGYLHNHARMWFASIWCFTLELPWELGADFFLRHLLDGDPAANTLSWRWVAGIQTRGKVYVARPSNISRYTDGRFGGVTGLAQDPAPLEAPAPPGPGTVPVGAWPDPKRPIALLLTEDDLSPGWLLRHKLYPRSTAVLTAASGRSPLAVSGPVRQFATEAARDCLHRHGDRLGRHGPVTEDIAAILDWAHDTGAPQIVIPHVPVGPARDQIERLAPRLKAEGLTPVRMLRPYDAAAWPHATHGFFRFKSHIPDLLDQMALSQSS